MTWKLGALWGVLLTVVEWLGYLAQNGGLGWAAKPMLLLTLVLFAYVGYSAFRMSQRFGQALLTSMLAGLIAGLFGSVGIFLTPRQTMLADAEQLLQVAFSSGMFAVLLGTIGALWARMGLVAKGGLRK